MRFWDSSALLTLFVEQPSTSSTRHLLRQDSHVVAWMLSDVELRSGLARLEREGAIDPARARGLAMRIDGFFEGVHLVRSVEVVKSGAKRLLGAHPLRAADALQLGAALAVSRDGRATVELVCLDARLADAARREGFAVLPSAA